VRFSILRRVFKMQPRRTLEVESLAKKRALGARSLAQETQQPKLAKRRTLALRVLRRFTGFLQTVLLALFAAGIAGQIAFDLERLAVVWIELT
jgi:hypothetical protein